MRRWRTALVLNALAVALAVSALSWASADDRAPERASAVGIQARVDSGPVDPTSEPEQGDDGTTDAPGPPPWAHGGGKDRGSLSAWKALTPRQRASTMAALARAHSDGMKEFAACRAAGGRDCVRPWPPGLAKRHLERQSEARPR